MGESHCFLLLPVPCPKGLVCVPNPSLSQLVGTQGGPAAAPILPSHKSFFQGLAWQLLIDLSKTDLCFPLDCSAGRKGPHQPQSSTETLGVDVSLNQVGTEATQELFLRGNYF